HFLEHEVPELVDSSVQLVISVIILYIFHPMLAYAALIAAVVMILFYGLFNKRFYNLNAALNRQKERQVEFLTTKKPRYIFS
ncbi:ABC transporter six-transmembrane domain-containing protein, partial [Streptococcus suis]